MTDFICASCSEVFEYDESPEELIRVDKECFEYDGEVNATSRWQGGDPTFAIVCDDCYQDFMAKERGRKKWLN
jgi:hypothetical protein|tara:strand:+ start:100 stop:318 length:219 start_codon:yes stop_codon:yes gene_type:complete